MNKSLAAKLVVWLGILLVIVGMFSRLSQMSQEVLDHDGYVLMTDVEKSFSAYTESMGAFTLPQRIHFWVTYRLLGGDMSDYLAGTAVTSAFALALIFLGTTRFFRAYPYLPFIVAGLALFNSHAIYLAGYPMLSYAMSFLVAIGLFLAFLHLAIQRDAAIPWYWVFAIAPAALFSNLTVTVPILTGALSVFLFRRYVGSATISVRSTVDYLKAIWPLAFFPMVYWGVYTVQPLTNMGRNRRPDMDPYFFFPDVYGTGFPNVVHFLAGRTYDLYSELIHPLRLGTVVVVILIAALCKLVAKQLNSSADLTKCSMNSGWALQFTTLYVVVTTFAIAVGGLLKLYPYGTARYASYLLFPVILIVGLSMHIVIDSVLGFVRGRHRQLLIACLAGSVVLGMATNSRIKTYRAYKKSANEIYGFLEHLDPNGADLILMGAYYVPVLKQLRPDIYNSDKALQIGWGHAWGRPPAGDVTLEMKRLLDSKAADHILVVASTAEQFKASYPEYSEYILDRYDLKQESSVLFSQSIWSGYFSKKTEFSPLGAGR